MWRRMMTAAAVFAGAMLLWLPGGHAADEAADQPLDPDAAKARVVELATDGQLTDELVAAFTAYAEARARKELDAVVSQDFWTWLDANPEMKFNLLIGLHPQYNPSVVKCLVQLREKFGKQVDTHTNLALAFAFVHGASPDRVREPLMGYLVKERPEPTMLESFEYYLRGERYMAKDVLVSTPWRLLVLVADNEIPISEREWALKEFGPRKPAMIGAIYDLPRYDYDQLRGEPRIGDLPHTLANIRKYGGICGDRAYFASRVLKSCGVPAMWDAGEGKRGGHAWVAWLFADRRGWKMTDCGRFRYDKYYTGQVHDPLTRSRMLDRDVELMAAAISKSEKSYEEALIGCHVYELFEEDARSAAMNVLKSSINRNTLCAPTWRLLADACAKGILPLEDGKKMYNFMLKEFKDYPDLTHEVLGYILKAKLESSEEANKREIASNLKLLDATCQIYDKLGRPDLAVKMRLLHGGYMEQLGLTKEALLLYMRESQIHVRRHFGFVELFDCAIAIFDDLNAPVDKVRYISQIAPKVPQWVDSQLDRKNNILSPDFLYVVGVYVDALREVGEDREAEKWEKKIVRE